MNGVRVIDKQSTRHPGGDDALCVRAGEGEPLRGARVPDERDPELVDGSLAAKRYRQLREWNLPRPCAKNLVRRLKEPPILQDDMHVAPPDFIGIGSMKSGTTWWYALLAHHPRIHTYAGTSLRQKELHFFDLLIATPFGVEQIAEYHSFFPRPADTLAGEWTPRYLSDFWAPAAIRKAAPEAKLLVLLRDPVNRFVSGVTHQVMKEAPRRMSIVDMWSSQFARGLYHQHLTRYLRHFPRQQLLVLQFERCIENPLGELERTFRFLGLDMPDTFTPEVLQSARNTTKPRRKIRLPPHIASGLIEEYEPDIRRLVAEFPEIDPGLWPNFRALVS